MIGLIYLFVIGVHFLLSILVVIVAVREAKKDGKAGWKYGIPVGIVMFSLLYWDLVPTHAVHRYYCLTEGGFIQNKSLDQWMVENPGVARTLNPDPKFSQEQYFEKMVGNNRYYRLPDGTQLLAHYAQNKLKHIKTDMRLTDGTHQYWLNQRFVWKTNLSKLAFNIRKRDELIVDLKSGEIIAEYIDFDTDIKALGLGARNFRDYRFWLNADSCELDGYKRNRTRFYLFEDLIANIGR